MKFIFEKLEIPDVLLIKPKVFEDKRGILSQVYDKDEFYENGINLEFVQDIYTVSKKNVIRGLHFQNKPKEQAKLVQCLKGKVLDIAVDIRKNSKTFGKYVSCILSEYNKNILFIPEGFAHGFLALEENNLLLYKLSNKHFDEYQNGIRWNDKDININWNIDNPIISDKDKNLPFLKEII
ncbi:MAG: dTDP-4-dehydrorhamnose 3,5-epimerase [Candidatus Sericytochromatia bacterium]|nr:MAG: dTDP-4-dehydrorhamnose 3,5-epimerase [Candidatus Sericytochromatia bacterium]